MMTQRLYNIYVVKNIAQSHQILTLLVSVLYKNRDLHSCDNN